MSPQVDRRRRQWFPLSVWFASGKTGAALQERFGLEGLAVWALYLAACKRNWTQGQFTYSTEADGWAQLGVLSPPDFTLDAFWSATGDLKQTSRRRSGHLTDVVCTHWGEWSLEVKRENDAERMARKRAENTADNPATIERTPSEGNSTEVEGYSYVEVEGTRRPPAENGGRPRPEKPARTQAALAFVRNGAAGELGEARDRYLAEEFNLAPLEVEEVLEAAGRARASAEFEASLEDVPTMAEELETAIAEEEDIPF